jgi:hypothetical protein
MLWRLCSTLVRTYKGDDRLLVPIASKKPSKRKLFEHLKTIYPGTKSSVAR